MVPTNKTNRYITINTNEYQLEIEQYLAKIVYLIDIKNMKYLK